VPRALEAICLKAMAAGPTDRYAMALDLAGDVKCWLADESVMAWREPLSMRPRRWARRHRTLVTSAAAVLVFSVVGLAGFAGILTGKNRELQRQQLRAEERQALAIEAVKKFRDVVAANSELRNRRDLVALRKELLKEPQEFFRTLRDQLQADHDTRPEALASLAAANTDLAGTTILVGSIADALPSYTESLAIRERLARDHPTVARYQRDLAESLNALGNMLNNMGRPAEAMESFGRALAILDRIARDHPAALDYQRDLARAHNDLGVLLSNAGQQVEALESHRKALAIFQKLAVDYPSITEYKRDLAWSHNNIGAILIDTGQPAEAPEAAEQFRRALALREQMANENPTSAEFQRDLAVSHYNLGKLQSATGHLSDALESYQRALWIRAQLVRDNPALPAYESDLAACHTNMGGVLIAMGQLTEAMKSSRLAAEIFEKLARDNPSIHFYQIALAATLQDLAGAEMGLDRWPEARDHLQRAIEHERKALAAMPRNPFNQQVFRSSLFRLAKVYRALNQPAEAIQVTRELAELSRGNATDLYNVACALALSAPLTRPEQQQALAAEAVGTLKEAIAAGWNDAIMLCRHDDLRALRNRDDFRRLLAKLFDRAFPADPFAR
jgi:tetratricopeptide (TPR) repeat protein